MSVFWDGLAGFLLERSRRERWLLAVLVLVGLPLLLAQGVALPLIERQAEARAALAEARATEVWLAEQAVAHARLVREGGEGRPRARDPIGVSGIEAGLREAELREAVTELANTADGGVTLRFDAVRFTTLAAWLSSETDRWGYELAGFTFERGARGDVVAAELRLDPLR